MTLELKSVIRIRFICTDFEVGVDHGLGIGIE